MTAGPLVVLHVSPHPDDEAIAAPATLLSLRGCRPQGLQPAGESRPAAADHDRRRHEAREAAGQAGVRAGRARPAARCLLGGRPGCRAGSSGADGRRVAGSQRCRPGRGAKPARRTPRARDWWDARSATHWRPAATLPTRWWMWGLWADLPLPTLFVPFDERQLKNVLHGLAAYAGELNRDDYTRLVEGRAEANRVLGSERVFGFGAAERRDSRYAELLTEVMRARRCAGSPQVRGVLESGGPAGAGGCPGGSQLVDRRRELRRSDALRGAPSVPDVHARDQAVADRVDVLDHRVGE